MAVGAHHAQMMIVDTSTWADFFNGIRSPHADRLDAALRDGEDLTVTPIILTEVLQGFRSDTGFQRVQRLLLSLHIVHPTVSGHVRAAQLFRSLRRKGVAVRGAVDCVIAQTCLDIQAEVLSPDADFEHIARHTPLRLWRS